ncbi:hypothetical protein ACFQY7_28050 [Actinomadura luteofluorescens]|uniref:hypothetical protein n=1 Tax=Actinomadura luteofluorescens TaxID=46163 RepID=UPI003625BAB2
MPIGLVTRAEYVLRTRQVYVDVMLRPRPVTEAVTDTGIGGASRAALSARPRHRDRAGEPEGLAQIAVTAPWLDGAVSAEWLERSTRLRQQHLRPSRDVIVFQAHMTSGKIGCDPA